MKQIFTYLLGFSLLPLLTVSCSKDQHAETRQQPQAPQVIQANVPAGQTYELNLGAGTAASIKIQALHHERSEIATTSDGSAVYQYTAGKGYSGGDEVTLQQTTTYRSQTGGCSQNYGDGQTVTSIRTIVVKLNVAN